MKFDRVEQLRSGKSSYGARVIQCQLSHHLNSPIFINSDPFSEQVSEYESSILCPFYLIVLVLIDVVLRK